MDRIYLTKGEKHVLQYLDSHETHYKIVNNEQYWADMISLNEKGLTITRNNEHRVYDIKLSFKGRKYLFCNPKLKNPLDWKWILQFTVTVIITIATIIGLFIGCTLLKLR